MNSWLKLSLQSLLYTRDPLVLLVLTDKKRKKESGGGRGPATSKSQGASPGALCMTDQRCLGSCAERRKGKAVGNCHGLDKSVLCILYIYKKAAFFFLVGSVGERWKGKIGFSIIKLIFSSLEKGNTVSLEFFFAFVWYYNRSIRCAQTHVEDYDTWESKLAFSWVFAKLQKYYIFVCIDNQWKVKFFCLLPPFVCMGSTKEKRNPL